MLVLVCVLALYYSDIMLNAQFNVPGHLHEHLTYVCIYSTCTFFDCQADFDVDKCTAPRACKFLRGIALYKSYYYYYYY